MNTLKDVIAYLMRHYPHPEDLSKARLTKMVYLADWKSAIDSGRQLTSIRWYFDNYGPYKPDVYTEVLANPALFRVENTNNMYGDRKSILTLVDEQFVPSVTDDAKKLLSHVITETEMLSWTAFISLVYGTYPITVSPRYRNLNLVVMAKRYNQFNRDTQADPATPPLH